MHWFFAGQLLGVLAAYGLLLTRLFPIHSLLAFALIQGGVAAAITWILRGPRWWFPLHVLFLPSIILASRQHFSSIWFLAGFALLLAIYWTSFRSRVPLYLTNRPTADALLNLIQTEGAVRVLDAGCGTGFLLRWLALNAPSLRFEGLEIAPLPWLLAWMKTRGLPNCAVVRKSLWHMPWGFSDVVYVFLSPVPMVEVWRKALAEMRPGALLVSNSFEIPGVLPEQVITVADRRKTRLLIYRIPSQSPT
ncbi:MAG: class I SAM-dependent methyltransferase [Betaproteobacteria bacterium]|nr:class I SAM-dependent methyltransferase [Betaproteobacteria bacterium]MDE2621909.1 class I SAM-dependent methyltransferase [Betaproteobacteria bacterium]